MRLFKRHGGCTYGSEAGKTVDRRMERSMESRNERDSEVGDAKISHLYGRVGDEMKFVELSV